MFHKIINFAAVLALACTGVHVAAQGTAEDYRRAFALGEKFSASKVYYSGVRPTWIGGTDSFWYVRNTPEGRVYVLVDAVGKRRAELFGHRWYEGISFLEGVLRRAGESSDFAFTTPTSVILENGEVDRIRINTAFTQPG